MTDELTIPAKANRHSVWRHACLRVCEATEQLGVETGPILNDLDLALTDLTTPGFRVPIDVYQRLVLACVLETDRHDLGFYINKNITALIAVIARTKLKINAAIIAGFNKGKIIFFKV